MGLHGPAVKNISEYENPAADVLSVLPVEKRRLTRHASDVAVKIPGKLFPPSDKPFHAQAGSK